MGLSAQSEHQRSIEYPTGTRNQRWHSTDIKIQKMESGGGLWETSIKKWGVRPGIGQHLHRLYLAHDTREGTCIMPDHSDTNKGFSSESAQSG